jgi:arginyl-tRNA synthetase
VTPTDLVALVRDATTEVWTGRGLGAPPVEIDLDRPRDPARGDYTTAVALRSARRAGVEPRALAGWLAEDLGRRPGIAAAEVAGPGFVNLRLSVAARASVIARIAAEGERYGLGRAPDGPRRNEPDPGEGAADGELQEARYAHARCAALGRHAADLGVTAGTDHRSLDHPAERELAALLAEFPGARSPRGHLASLTEAFHRFDAARRVLPLGDQPTTEAHRARVALVGATRQVLANGLRRLGADAPERM